MSLFGVNLKHGSLMLRLATSSKPRFHSYGRQFHSGTPPAPRLVRIEENARFEGRPRTPPSLVIPIRDEPVVPVETATVSTQTEVNGEPEVLEFSADLNRLMQRGFSPNTADSDDNISSNEGYGSEVYISPSDSGPEPDVPDAPTVPMTQLVTEVEQVSKEAAAAAVTGVEPTFASQGLGSWWPPGMVQQCLEGMHVSMSMPWWMAILAGTIVVRLALFPLVLKSQKTAAILNNCMPQMQIIQLRMTEARQSGNAMLAAKYAYDLQQFMKEKNINPLKQLILPLSMAPIFVSVFIGLREMASLPVQSLKTGGLAWFTDLTVTDPYYLLPVMTCSTLLLIFEKGVDGSRVSGQHGQIMKYVMRGIPIIMFPFIINFPSALLWYWMCTNSVSLVQVTILKIPQVRTFFKIEQLRKFDKDTLPIKSKGFKESFKDSWTNMKITRELEARGAGDEISFKRAGKGPIPKTFKYDPTKGKELTAFHAKQKGF